MDNKAAELSWWDMKLLETELLDLRGKIDLSTTGFTEAEISKMLNEENKISIDSLQSFESSHQRQEGRQD